MTAERGYAEVAGEAVAAEAAREWGRAARLWREAVEAARRTKRSLREAARRAGEADERAEPTNAREETAEEVADRAATEVQHGAPGRAAPLFAEAAAIEPGHPLAAVWARGREEARRRMLQTAELRHGLRVGQVLEHRTRGVVTATCEYLGEGRFRVGAEEHASINKAANAAAASIGQASKNLNGWLYFGLEKRDA